MIEFNSAKLAIINHLALRMYRAIVNQRSTLEYGGLMTYFFVKWITHTSETNPKILRDFGSYNIKVVVESFLISRFAVDARAIRTIKLVKG